MPHRYVLQVSYPERYATISLLNNDDYFKEFHDLAGAKRQELFDMELDSESLNKLYTALDTYCHDIIFDTKTDPCIDLKDAFEAFALENSSFGEVLSKLVEMPYYPLASAKLYKFIEDNPKAFAIEGHTFRIRDGMQVNFGYY